MGRFASTVAYYESARPPYGAAFFAAVAEQLGLDRSQRLLDVGAGPGILAIGFAPYCRRGHRRRSGAGDGRGRARGGRAHRRRGEVHRGPFRGRRREARRIRRRHHRSRGPLARSRACPSRARSRHRAARKNSGAAAPRASKTGATRGSKPSTTVRDRWKGERPARDHHTFFADGQFTRTGTIRVEGTYAVPVERLVDRVLSMSTSRRSGSATKSPR